VLDKLVADGTVLAFGLSEQEAITHLFTGFTDPDASRSELVRSLIFHLPAPK